ncbi:hypothetical protein C1645_820979 [Glomus cerebriforme]|uniref:F-box domain-containing protein n=1 Tax=Glomus cerebriforme TaxID=658196 RepID=A0A397T5J1_9GLOM|nr:hypothetical protein C1645_820979 [Glomus cerebriforme]
MSSQLPIDCFNEIFECLEEDKVTLYSCLLVNRLWCRISVKILWRNIWGFKCIKVSSQIRNTLISCLPNESKDLLFKNGVFIPTSIPKSPLFNYPSFCEVLSILDLIIDEDLYNKKVSKNQKFNITPLNRNYLITQEILKMFMKQISLKKLKYDLDIYGSKIPNFINFPGAKDCLKNLSEIRCNSNIHSEFFYQLSQICHNIQSLTIEFGITISDGLKDLISSQNSLRSLSFMRYDVDGDDDYDDDVYNDDDDWDDYDDYKHYTKIVSSLTKHSSTLTTLHLRGTVPLSFISKFTNLKELVISFEYETFFITFKKIQYIIFPHLEILKFVLKCPKVEMIIKFLENNGKNLKEFHVNKHDKSLNLAIAKFCPNLKSLYTKFNDKLSTLKVILNNCQKLESIKISCGHLEDKKLLEIIAKYSPKSFHELKLRNYEILDSEDLEHFLIVWRTRISQKSISFIISSKNKKNKKLIEKYKKLGVIKKLEYKPELVL